VPLADFTITVHSEPERAVRVVVYDTLKALRAAATRYDNAKLSNKQRGTFKDTGGVCHRFEWTNAETNESHPLCAIVRLAEPHLGVGVVSHELAHAAVWIQELDNPGERLTTDNDEPFCWLLGELVRQTINTMTDRGIYT
jgi:hypothetical protein